LLAKKEKQGKNCLVFLNILVKYAFHNIKYRPHTRAVSLFHAALDIATYHISHKGKLRAHTTRRSMSLCDLFIHDMSQPYYTAKLALSQIKNNFSFGVWCIKKRLRR